MTTEQHPRDLQRFLLEDLDEIESAVTRYSDGQLSAYQTVAVQLRNLLTDTSRAGPLLPRVFPDVKFETLRRPARPKPPNEKLPPGVNVATIIVFDPRGSFIFGGSKPPRIELAIDPYQFVAPGVWINDWICRPDVRIRDLIHEVASKDAAHTDSDSGATMSRLESSLVYMQNGAAIEMARPVLVRIGEYVATRLRSLVAVPIEC